MASKLEEALLDAGRIEPSAEHQIDAIRMIMRGKLGTQDDRKQIHAILKKYPVPNSPRHRMPHAVALMQILGDPSSTTRSTYLPS